jgi:prepilin-type N-terminal cleavage/methylation domain-containing protein
MELQMRSAHLAGRAASSKCGSKPKKTAGFTLIELLIVVAILMVLFAIAIPYLTESKVAAREASVISMIRSFSTAQTLYRERFGNGRSYADLDILLEKGLVGPTLANGLHEGYAFTVTVSSDSGFSVTAVPTDGKGRRAFYVDQSAVIRYTTDGSVPDGSSPPL